MIYCQESNTQSDHIVVSEKGAATCQVVWTTITLLSRRWGSCRVMQLDEAAIERSEQAGI
jgi:type II secretory pathway component PulL